MMHSFQNLIYQIQNVFVRLLVISKIPLILLLSCASGYTTYYGMKLFITGWIALIITIAVQAILVMATVELSRLHWRASLLHFSSTVLYLLVALSVSIFFSYFKFYEISESTALQEIKYNRLKKNIDQYLNTVLTQKSERVEIHNQRVLKARYQSDQAYLGTHPAMPNRVQGIVGKGSYWEYFNEGVEREQRTLSNLKIRFDGLDKEIKELSVLLSKQGLAELRVKSNYQAVKTRYQMVGDQSNSLMSDSGQATLMQPSLESFEQYIEIKPSLDVLGSLAPLALFLAVMVDLFTLILSYRLEVMPPETLSNHEKRLAFLGLQEFPDWTINQGGHLETRLEHNEEEAALDYDDSWRKLIVGMLLNRGMLRKVSGKKVEFSPQLYSLIIDQLIKDIEDTTPAQTPESRATPELPNTTGESLER